MISLPENAPFSSQQRAWLNGFLTSSLGMPAAPTTVSAPIAAPGPTVATAQVAEAPQALYNRDNPFPARVVYVKALNGKDSDKDVRAVALDLTGSGLTYQAGDALGVYPENDHELIESILAVLGATGEEPVVTPESRVVPARLALLKGYDITRVGESFLRLLSETARDETEAARLTELAEEDAEDWLVGRDVLDVLREFHSINAPVREIVASLQPLQPRLYSIASSQKSFPDQVHLTIGVVRYRANDRERQGVASTFMADRVGFSSGQRVGIFVHPAPHFRLPESGETPVIMVGPGTGIAPFRSFLQERKATGARGGSWLFFGDQKQSCDFLYQQELEDYLSEGTLSRLDTAFSRDQAEKIYVQNRMLEHATELWQWLEEGAHLYVCGDAKRMAKDVDRALHQIAREHGKLDELGAKTFVQSLVKNKRYQRDVY